MKVNLFEIENENVIASNCPLNTKYEAVDMVAYQKAIEALKHYAVEDLFDPVVGRPMNPRTGRLVYELGGIARAALKDLGEAE